MRRLVIYTALFVAIVLGGLWGAKQLLGWGAPTHIVKEDASVLLERVLEVRKLVTVEGYFSEIYSYEDYLRWEVPWLGRLLKKSILLRVDARVAIGYDLKKVDFTIKPQERIIIIDALPNPEILYIEPKMTYYDFAEGYLNDFDAADLTKINQDAVDKIGEKVRESFEKEESELKDKAYDQVQDFLALVQIIAEESGFEVKYQMKTLDSSSQDSLSILD